MEGKELRRGKMWRRGSFSRESLLVAALSSEIGDTLDICFSDVLNVQKLLRPPPEQWILLGFILSSFLCLNLMKNCSPETVIVGIGSGRPFIREVMFQMCECEPTKKKRNIQFLVQKSSISFNTFLKS